MFLARYAGIAATIALLAVIVTSPVCAGEVRLISDRLFDVSLTDASGSARPAFAPGSEVVFSVRFSLALSEVKEYPVVLTIQIGDQSIEAYNGKLTEGNWMISEKVKVLANWGNQVPYKVILKVRMFSRSGAGAESYYSYYKSEGGLKIGY